MVEDLKWFGIVWNLGPGSDPSSSQNSLLDMNETSMENNIVENNRIIIQEGKSSEKKSKKMKTADEESLFETSFDGNIKTEMNQETDPAGFFFGVDLSLFSGVFYQSQRKELYLAAWRRLLTLKLGEYVRTFTPINSGRERVGKRMGEG